MTAKLLRYFSDILRGKGALTLQDLMKLQESRTLRREVK